MTPPDPEPCERCRGRGVVSIGRHRKVNKWFEWSHYDVCPDCDGTGVRAKKLPTGGP